MDLKKVSVTSGVEPDGEGLIFGRTEVLRAAFDEAKPKMTATLKNAQRIELSETPTHVCFSGNDEFLVLAQPQAGLLVLNCALLQQHVPGPHSYRFFVDV